MRQFKKLNVRPLKMYYHYSKINSNNHNNDYIYFNFKRKKYRLDDFIKITSSWISKEYTKTLPNYIHGISWEGFWDDDTYFIEIIEGYNPKINIYKELK